MFGPSRLRQLDIKLSRLNRNIRTYYSILPSAPSNILNHAVFLTHNKVDNASQHQADLYQLLRAYIPEAITLRSIYYQDMRP